MKVKCDGCGAFHEVSPTGMAVIIQAIQDGDLQQVTGDGVAMLCLGDAFSPETLGSWRHRLEKKTVIVFDKTRWSVGDQPAAA